MIKTITQKTVVTIAVSSLLASAVIYATAPVHGPFDGRALAQQEERVNFIQDLALKTSKEIIEIVAKGTLTQQQVEDLLDRVKYSDDKITAVAIGLNKIKSVDPLDMRDVKVSQINSEYNYVVLSVKNNENIKVGMTVKFRKGSRIQFLKITSVDSEGIIAEAAKWEFSLKAGDTGFINMNKSQ